MESISFPTSGTDSPIAVAPVAPVEIAADGVLHLDVAGVVGVIQREFLQGGEMAFDAVEPRGAGRREMDKKGVGDRFCSEYIHFFPLKMPVYALPAD